MTCDTEETAASCGGFQAPRAPEGGVGASEERGQCARVSTSCADTGHTRASRPVRLWAPFMPQD